MHTLRKEADRHPKAPRTGTHMKTHIKNRH